MQSEEDRKKPGRAMFRYVLTFSDFPFFQKGIGGNRLPKRKRSWPIRTFTDSAQEGRARRKGNGEKD